MEELLERIAKCVELGKINEKTPYPPYIFRSIPVHFPAAY